MKKLNYLLAVVALFAFTACGSGSSTADDAANTEVVSSCNEDCTKACCLGCKATDGEARCKADHSCCPPKEQPAKECCGGGEGCCQGEDGHSHEHDHEHGESHDHDHEHDDDHNHEH
ncbi:MAG: hypothetical protein VX347_01845 [Bacteroidota bacterium]|nr:hypothetical protein [Bacteroidota bacterium]